jgi:ABC-type transport system involved in multi-copper enzyme maturation permease subunit
MASTPLPSAPVRPVSSPGFLYSSLRVFDLSLGEMLWSRRTIFMALVVGVPMVLAVLVRGAHFLGAPGIRVENTAVNGPAIFGLMIWAFYLRFCIPVLGVFYGTSLIADEVEDKTITYLFTRPISRASVLFGKYLAYMVCTLFVVLPSVTVVWLLVTPIGGSLGQNFVDLLKDLVILGAGLAVYGAVFALIGAAMKRPLLVGLVFTLGFEPFVMVFPGSFKRLTVAYYLQGLVPQAMPNDSAVSLVQAIFREIPSLTTSVVALVLITVVCLWLAARRVTNKEYILEQ